MKKRKPPYALVSILLVLIGVAVVMGGRMYDLNNGGGDAELEAAIAAKDAKPQEELKGVKPGDLQEAAQKSLKSSKQEMQAGKMPDVPVVPLGSAVKKSEDIPPPKKNETSNHSLRGY